MRKVAAAALVLGISAAAFAAVDRARSAAQSECAAEEQPVGGARGAASSATEIKLEPREDSKLITFPFDQRRSELSRPVVINAEPDLEGIGAGQIEIVTAPLIRADKRETLPRPTFTPPRISADLKRIRFTVCLDPTDETEPGTYSGAVEVNGPRGVSGTAVQISATTKFGSDWILIAEIVSLLVALGVLTLKGVADYKKSEIDGNAQPTFKWGRALTFIWRSPTGILGSLLGLGVAMGSTYSLYHGSETWGTDLWVDLLAVGQATLAAVGIQGGFQGVVDLVSRGGTR